MITDRRGTTIILVLLLATAAITLPAAPPTGYVLAIAISALGILVAIAVRTRKPVD